MHTAVQLTEEAQKALEKIQELVPHVESCFVVETALAITAALYEKGSQGATIQVKTEDGRIEELRFKVKKPSRKKAGQA